MSSTTNLAAASGRQLASGFFFGLSPEAIAASLRALAEEIEREAIPVQDLRHITRAAPDDFVMHTLILRFAARAELETQPADGGAGT